MSDKSSRANTEGNAIGSPGINNYSKGCTMVLNRYGS
jgi:hypothetical protein